MPFRGYFRRGDPRGPMFGSQGAVWPTVPAYRYRLGSENATGSWEFLKTTGILVEFAQEIGNFITAWRPIADEPPCFDDLSLTREWIPVLMMTYWRLRISTPCTLLPWQVVKVRGAGRANTDIKLGLMRTPLGPPGTPGSKLMAYQVEFDEEDPPAGWPPWA